MMELSTPALAFPAISMLMLAYTNRFMVISQRIRSLHNDYKANGSSPNIQAQISNLRFRCKLIKWMQAIGVISFMLCSASIMLILYSKNHVEPVFGTGMGFLIASLLLAFWEIMISTNAIELELQDMEE